MDGGHPKCVQLRAGGGGVTRHVYERTSLFIFLANLAIYNEKKKRTEMTKKYLESLRLNISNCYYKKGKHHLHLQQEESWRL